MKMDISQLALIANRACKNINAIVARASNIDLEALKVQNEILKDTYKAIDAWIKDQH